MFINEIANKEKQIVRKYHVATDSPRSSKLYPVKYPPIADNAAINKIAINDLANFLNQSFF